MKELGIKHRQEIEYRELFDVMIDSNSCEDHVVGLTSDGELLYIENKLMNNSSAYWVQSVFYSIDQEEFRAFLALAKERGYLEKAIAKGRTTEEELKALGGEPIFIDQKTDAFRGKIENINGKIIFSYEGGEYELRSHPYEPCLYIYKDDEMIKILHNAFEANDLPSVFSSGGTVRAIDGRDFDRDAFCKVLDAAIKDRRFEMNWTFAAKMVE